MKSFLLALLWVGFCQADTALDVWDQPLSLNPFWGASNLRTNQAAMDGNDVRCSSDDHCLGNQQCAMPLYQYSLCEPGEIDNTDMTEDDCIAFAYLKGQANVLTNHNAFTQDCERCLSIQGEITWASLRNCELHDLEEVLEDVKLVCKETNLGADKLGFCTNMCTMAQNEHHNGFIADEYSARCHMAHAYVEERDGPQQTRPRLARHGHATHVRSHANIPPEFKKAASSTWGFLTKLDSLTRGEQSSGRRELFDMEDIWEWLGWDAAEDAYECIRDVVEPEWMKESISDKCHDEFYENVRSCASQFGQQCAIKFDKGCLTKTWKWSKGKNVERGGEMNTYAVHRAPSGETSKLTHVAQTNGKISATAEVTATATADMDFKLDLSSDPGLHFGIDLNSVTFTAEAKLQVETETNFQSTDIENKIFPLATSLAIKNGTFWVEGFPINVNVEIQPVAILRNWEPLTFAASGGIRLKGSVTMPELTAEFNMGSARTVKDDPIEVQAACKDRNACDATVDVDFGTMKKLESSFGGEVLLGLQLKAIINGIEVFMFVGMGADVQFKIVSSAAPPQFDMTPTMRAGWGSTIDIPGHTLAGFLEEECNVLAKEIPDCAGNAQDMAKTACVDAVKWLVWKTGGADSLLEYQLDTYIPVGFASAVILDLETALVHDQKSNHAMLEPAPLGDSQQRRNLLNLIEDFPISHYQSMDQSWSIAVQQPALSTWQKFFAFTNPRLDDSVDFAYYHYIDMEHEAFRAKHCIDTHVSGFGQFTWYVENSWCSSESRFCCIMGGAHRVVCDGMTDDDRLEVDGQLVCSAQYGISEGLVRISGTGHSDNGECDGTLVKTRTMPGWWAEEISWYVKDAETGEVFDCGNAVGDFATDDINDVAFYYFYQECCLPVKELTVVCQDSWGDGWHGGDVYIAGHQFCDYFNGDYYEQPLDLTGSCETGTRLFHEDSCLAMPGCCWNENSFNGAGRCHDMNDEQNCGRYPAFTAPAEVSSCTINNEHEWDNGYDWQTDFGSVYWYQWSDDLWDWTEPCWHGELHTIGHHTVQAVAPIRSDYGMWVDFWGNSAIWVDSLELDMGNFNKVYGGNGIVGICMSWDYNDYQQIDDIYLHYRGCCQGLFLSPNGWFECYRPDWAYDGWHYSNFYDESHIRGRRNLNALQRRILSGDRSVPTPEERREYIAAMDADVKEHPEHLVRVDTEVAQSKDFGVYYTKTILERVLYEKSEAIKTALAEAGYDDALALVPSFELPGAHAQTRPTVSDEEYARFLEHFTSDETSAVVAAVVNAKFPEHNIHTRFLREHFQIGATTAVEREFREIFDIFADVKAMLPATCDPALLSLFL